MIMMKMILMMTTMMMMILTISMIATPLQDSAVPSFAAVIVGLFGGKIHAEGRRFVLDYE